MGVLPLQLPEGSGWKDLGMTGNEFVSISGVADLQPRQKVDVQIEFENGDTKTVTATLRIDTENELEYYRNGGILHYVLRNLARDAKG